MIPNSTSPTTIRTVAEQLRLLHQRRASVDRLIRALESYQRVTPGRTAKRIA
jgi:hypothetical protein